jgi:hypothetical protein
MPINNAYVAVYGLGDKRSLSDFTALSGINYLACTIVEPAHFASRTVFVKGGTFQETDTLDGKLLQVLVDLRGQSVESVYAHVYHKRRVDCPCAVISATAFLSKETKVSPPSQWPS